MQGFNMGRYYPPSTESQPTFNTASSMRAVTKRTTSGTQTVRFEMPFHVWCTHCPRDTVIPQGVRFNAEKKKVGNYYSTPIWSFRMKHTVCGQWVEIRTDPENADYVVYEGGKKRDFGGEDKYGAMGDILSKEERDRRREDAFTSLEGKKDEEVKSKESKERVEELRAVRERDWSDPYEANRRVRNGFRRGRKVWEAKAEDDEEIREKYGIEMDVLEETESDKIRAKLVDFGAGESTAWRPLFEDDRATDCRPKTSGMTKTQKLMALRKHRLQSQLRTNTRATLDPFSSPKESFLKKPLCSTRRRAPAGSLCQSHTESVKKSSPATAEPSLDISTAHVVTSTAALVAYDSSSD